MSTPDPVDVLVTRLDPGVPLPAYAHPGDAGADLVTTVDTELAPGERAVLPTGLAMALPVGFAAFVHPRSGLAARCGVALVNAPGTVDAGYRGEIRVIVVNLDPREPVVLRRGDRIAQLVVQRVERASFREVERLPGSARGTGGFGSTGGADAPVPWAGPPVDVPRDRQGRADMFRRRRADSADSAESAESADAAEPAEDAPDGAPESRDDASAGGGSAPEAEEAAEAEEAGAAGGAYDRSNGPWDVSEVDEPSAGHQRLDLGAIWMPGIEGMELRVEVDQQSQRLVAVTAVLGQSALQVQPFAAPRTRGIWHEVRAELAESLAGQGAALAEQEGAFGTELLAQLPLQLPDGSQAVQVARFVGVDGPRWFLRGVISGEAVVNPAVAEPLESLFRGVVVVRGEAPMARGDLLELTLPQGAVSAADESEEQQEEAADADRERAPLQPFERGPEITEIR